MPKYQTIYGPMARASKYVRGNSQLVQSTFLFDAAKAWNKIPINFKHCVSIRGAKREIKKCVTQQPI